MYTTDIRTAEQLDAMKPGQLKSYEIKLRRAAARQGLMLKKHRARDRFHIFYGTWQLVDAKTNAVVWSADDEDGYGLDLTAHYAFSGDAPPGLYLQPKPASAKLLDGLIDPDPLPSWLTEADLDVYCQSYRDGFRGPINWYRGFRGDELLRARSLEHAKITQPCHLMVGSLDRSRTLLADAFVNVDQNVTDLRGNIVLDGAGHWLPLERTKEVNAALLGFLRGFPT